MSNSKFNSKERKLLFEIYKNIFHTNDSNYSYIPQSAILEFGIYDKFRICKPLKKLERNNFIIIFKGKYLDSKTKKKLKGYIKEIKKHDKKFSLKNFLKENPIMFSFLDHRANLIVLTPKGKRLANELENLDKTLKLVEKIENSR